VSLETRPADGLPVAERSDFRDQVGAVADLLRGGPAPGKAQEQRPPPADANPPPTLADALEPAAPAASEPDAPAPAKPGTLQAIAEQLGVDPAVLYDVEIPTAEGDSIRLGELKDYYQGRDQVEAGKLAWAEEREQQEADIRRARAELAELLSAVPRDKLNPQVIEAARRSHLARMEIERQRVNQLIPAWQDDQAREADLTGIREHLAEFGLPAGALSEIQDARMLAYLRSNLERKRRVEQALAQVRVERSTTGQARTPSNSARRAPTGQAPGSTRGGSSNNRATPQRVRAIADLLRGE